MNIIEWGKNSTHLTKTWPRRKLETDVDDLARRLTLLSCKNMFLGVLTYL
jgi:hypothetical protein